MDQVLSNEDQVSVLSHLSIVKEKEFVSCQNNQKVKFERLLNKSKQHSAVNSIDLSGEQLKKWVVNISKYKLSEPETSVLAKGLNFATAPSVIPIDEYVLSTEKACSQLAPAKAESMRGEITNILKKAKPPVFNISKEEKLALDKIRKDTSIQILPADKGRATVIMDKDDYKTRVKDMLED